MSIPTRYTLCVAFSTALVGSVIALNFGPAFDPPGFYANFDRKYQYGWPFTFLTRAQWIPSGHGFIRQNPWEYQSAVVDVRLPALLSNLGIFTVVCMIAVSFCRRNWQRRAAHFRYTIKTLLVLTAVWGVQCSLLIVWYPYIRTFVNKYGGWSIWTIQRAGLDPVSLFVLESIVVIGFLLAALDWACPWRVPGAAYITPKERQ